MTLEQLNSLPLEKAEREFIRCCGSSRWASMMAIVRPFSAVTELYDAAERVWQGLSSEDWREAFLHHPRIGDLQSLRQKFAATAQWANAEQAAVQGSPEEVLRALAEGNRSYEAKFGYIFIVCATGKSAAEMLALLKSRMQNDPTSELSIAAAEQNKIIRLRLEKLLSEERR